MKLIYIILILIVFLAPLSLSETAFNFLTKGFADTLYCDINTGCPFITTNLTISGNLDMNGSSITNVDTITANEFIGGNFSGDGTGLTGICLANGSNCIVPNQRGTTGFYLYNDSDFYYFNESMLNTTVLDLTATTTYVPINYTVDAGTEDSGNLTSIQVLADGDSLNVSESTGSNPLVIVVNFTGVMDFNSFISRHYYVGGSGHGIEVEAWNHNTQVWDTGFLEITDMDGFAIIDVPVLDTTDYILDGSVSLRYRHIQNGNPNHEFFLDYVALIDGFTTITTTQHDALSGRDDSDNHPWAMPTDGTRPFTGNVTINNANLEVTGGINVTDDVDADRLCIDGNCLDNWTAISEYESDPVWMAEKIFYLNYTKEEEADRLTLHFFVP